MAIVGRERIEVISRTIIGNDPDYGAPIYEETSRIISNALVQHSSSVIEYTLQSVNVDVDITVYISPREEVYMSDTVVYEGVKYKQSQKSVLWKVPQGFTLKPKRILFLKAQG